jgi:hypothetical protein
MGECARQLIPGEGKMPGDFADEIIPATTRPLGATIETGTLSDVRNGVLTRFP